MLVNEISVEKLVEIVTREVLVALSEQEHRQEHGEHCHEECAEGICVHTCFDNVGQVIKVGAERLTSTLGGIPQDPSLGHMIDHTMLKPDATADQIVRGVEQLAAERDGRVLGRVHDATGALQGF